MTITAQIIADSISPDGIRLTTMQLRYPRFIHAEFMTHRVFSRNARSSRAVPVAKMIEEVRTDPAMPIHWGKNQPGMQAREELTGVDRSLAQSFWLRAARKAADEATNVMSVNAHKQIVNRILEPFLHIDVVVTATEWNNFYALRRHEDAQPDMRILADRMWEAQECSPPRELGVGEWHTPYSPHGDLPVSVVRCARVSYSAYDRSPSDYEAGVELHDRLKAAGHWSPFEHQATPDDWAWGYGYEYPHQHGNFRGWRQYRKMIEVA